ncbi:F208B protein, partial [Psilopogon haemacephalus]|nr:F208B protein [Psilopogon haemacephalus]
LYCPWRGQLSIQGHILCNISLRTPYSSTIPAQLPPSLDINYVMGLSDLKKKLPAAAFGKKNYVENEVCFQGIYFSLYEVEISNKDQYKMDQLVKTLKEKDLAIIKYLQDQGVLILLTSSALARDEGFDPTEPISLLALFLFTSSRSLCPRAGKQDPKDGREGCDDGNVSLKIASVLPGLRYALQKASSSSCGDRAGTNRCIKKHFQEYTKLHQNAKPTSGQSNEVPLSSLLPPTKDEWTNPFKKHSGQSFSQLQHYLSDPSSYALELSAALGCLTDAAHSLSYHSETDCKMDFSSAGPTGSSPSHAVAEIKGRSKNPTVGLEQSGEGPLKDVTTASKLWVQQSRRKSSRAVVTSNRKKWSPLKMQMHPMGDSGRNRKATKKMINMTFSFPKKTGITTNSSEPLLKLANLQSPHKRKRGAEVLSAEFVHKTQSEPLQKDTPRPSDLALEAKRQKAQKNPDVRKVSETLRKPEKSKVVKSVSNGPWKLHAKKQEGSEWKEPSALPSDVSSPHRAADSQESESRPGRAADLGLHPKGNDFESHALNLLADLALGSCIPSFIPRDSEMMAVPSSGPPKEQQRQRKHKSLSAVSDHEYYRVEKLAKGVASPSTASPNHNLPPDDKTDLKDLASVPSEKNAEIFSKKNGMSPSPSKPHVLPPNPQVVPPGETQEAAEVNKHSFISAEHSYASQMPEHSKKHLQPRGAPYPGPAPSRNGTRHAQAGPLVGKVLPFRHQQNSSHLQRPFQAVATRRRSSLLPPRLRDNFTKSHTVKVCGESMKVTCHWEAEYLFNLDSRYTNDALEKAVIRALHGPWDPDLPDDMEEMKLILHMWVALFYSKPSKLLSNTRKVVEHSNPKKYVSINSTGEFFELSDDGEDWFGLETCPADSQSDPDQTPRSSLNRSIHDQGPFHPEQNPTDSQTDADGTPGVVTSAVSSSSEELPCEEEQEKPSSTSCPENLSLTECADESLAVKDRQPVVSPEEHLHDISTESQRITAIKEQLKHRARCLFLVSAVSCASSDKISDLCFTGGGDEPQTPKKWDSKTCLSPVGSCIYLPLVTAAQGTGHSLSSSLSRGSEEQPKEGLLDATITPRPSDELSNAGKPLVALGREEPHSQAPNSSTAPQNDGCGEQQESRWAAGTGGCANPPEDMESVEDAGHCMDIEDSSRATSNGQQHVCEPLPLEECPTSAEPDGTSGGDRILQDPFRHPKKEEEEVEEGKNEKEDSEWLPGEMAPSLNALQEPWEASGVDTNGFGLAHAASPAAVESPCDKWLRLLPSQPSLVCGAQWDSVTGSLGPAGETLGAGLEQKEENAAPSAGRRWAPAGSKAAGPARQTLSPDSSSVCLVALDGAAVPGAAPENQEATANIQSPAQSDLGGSSCFSQKCGGDICPDFTLLRAGESNQEGKKVLVEAECSSPSAHHTDVLDESSGVGGGQGLGFFDSTALAGVSEAGESNDVCPSAEKSPKSNKTTTPMVANTLQGPENSLPHLLESEPSSLVAEEMSAMKEHPRQLQSSPNTVHRDSAPASPSQQVPLPHGGDADPQHHSEQREQGPILCQGEKSSEQAGAAEVKKVKGSCQAEPVESSPLDVPMLGDPGLMPPSPPHGQREGQHSIQPGSILRGHPEIHSPNVILAPDGTPGSCCMGQLPAGACSLCASPEGQTGILKKEPILPEDLEEGSSTPLASLPPLEEPPSEPQSVCNQGEHETEGSSMFSGPHHASMEVGEGGVPTVPFPTQALDVQRERSGESLELPDTEDIPEVLPRSKQLLGKDTQEGLSSEDLFGTRSSNSDQEYSGGTSHSLLTARGSYSRRSTAGTRTNCDDSSGSSVCTEAPSEDWSSLETEQDCSWAEDDWPLSPGETSSGHIPPYISIRDSQGVSRDYQNFMVTKWCQEGTGNVQPSERCSHCAGHSHLLRSLMGTGRGLKEVTQHTLDTERLRFHCKLKQVLRSGQPPFSTSKSIFPQAFSPQVTSEAWPVPEAPIPPSPRSRSPLQVTILPSNTWPSRLSRPGPSGWHGDTLCHERNRPRSHTSIQDHAAPFHLSKLSYNSELQDSRGDITLILDEYAELNRVMLGRAEVGSEERGPDPAHQEATGERPETSLPGRMAACEEMIAELCSALRFRLRSLAKEACGQAGMFYLVETSQDPFFARVKTLLKKSGHVEMEPLSFCEGKLPDADRLLIVIRNEDISSHIHNVPCLLKLKHCPNVVFAGVDIPEDLTGHIYQELFHAGGFMVSDKELLETVTLGQLKEVVEVLEKLNRSGRWKWLLHYKERKKLREDGSRVDTSAHRKYLILRSCQDADLIEVLHFHTCDSAECPSSEYLRCLLNLQVQHIGARFAVYLTEKPDCSRELLESRGILVADVSTFLGTMQKVAAPFRPSCW